MDLIKMERKWLKWCLMLSVAPLILALIGIVIYILAPFIISTLTGFPSSDVCGYEAGGVSGSLTSLCNSLRAFLGISVMLLIILAGIIGFLAMVFASIEILQSKEMSGLSKILWLGAIWIIAGVLAAAIYYFVEKPKN